MPTTSNFGWTTPADTDLVKDGAAAIRTLGNNIDASLVDLKGGTTGQVLAKATNADLDFTWTNGGDITEVAAGIGISGGGTSGAVTITNSMATAIDAKGDLVAGTGADTFARLAVGSNNTVLTADSTTATGLRWGSVSVSKSYSLLNAGGTNLTGAGTITVSGISNVDDILILIENAGSTSASSGIRLRLNTDSTSKYSFYGIFGSTWPDATWSGLDGATSIPIGFMGNNAGLSVSGYARIYGCNTSGIKTILSAGAGEAGGSGHLGTVFGGAYSGTSPITSISLVADSGNFDEGKVYVYAAA